MSVEAKNHRLENTRPSPETLSAVYGATKGGRGFPTNVLRTPPPPGFADAMETSKKTENKEKETGSVLFSPRPATR